MTFIVLDLEWSQPMSKELVVKKDDKTLPLEIIQIGALAVRDGKILPDTFSSYVKPKYYVKLKKWIRELTGITEKELKNAPGFGSALNSFLRWCKAQNAELVCTWGPDDFPSLKGQAEFFGQDISALPPFADIQPIAARQCGLSRSQISLGDAVQKLGIDETLKFHSALNDAYYTAMVLCRMDNLPEKIEWQKKADYAKANRLVEFKMTGGGELCDMYPTERLPFLFHCPLCGKTHSLMLKFITLSKEEEYKSVRMMTVTSCKGHALKSVYEFTRYPRYRRHNSYTYTVQTVLATKQEQEEFKAVMEQRKKDPKKWKRTRKAMKGSKQNI